MSKPELDKMLRGLSILQAQAAASEQDQLERRMLVVALRRSGAQPVRVVTFGRSPNSDVVINDEYASLEHARAIQYDDGSVVVEDCCTTNGTHINGRRTNGQELIRPGDVLRIGRTELPWKA